MTYGERLNMALTLARKTRRDLAQHLAVSEQAVGQVINGHTKALSAENTVRAARLLGCSAFWLATGEDGPHKVSESLAPPYMRWPFPNVSYSRILALSDMQRELLEALLLKALNELAPPGADQRPGQAGG